MTPLEQDVLLGLLDSFLDDSVILEVLKVVQGGKEATVYCCRATEKLGGGLVAAKIYRPREHRKFKNDSVYRQARLTGNSREERAARSGERDLVLGPVEVDVERDLLGAELGARPLLLRRDVAERRCVCLPRA